MAQDGLERVGGRERGAEDVARLRAPRHDKTPPAPLKNCAQVIDFSCADVAHALACRRGLQPALSFSGVRLQSAE
jgi:hypothetical protein